MLFKDEQARSLAPRLFFTGVFSATVAISGWFMFGNTSSAIDWLAPYELRGDFMRRVVLFSCLVVYLIRLLVTTFVNLKRQLVWAEALPVSVLMSFAAYAYARVGGANSLPLGIVEAVGAAFYVIGSYLNTRSEHTRHVWKQEAENKGRLYTQGLFKYSMHINYFGDILLFTGLAMIAHHLTVFIIPLAMTVNFIFNIIPSLDRYLEKKYGDEFRDYAKKTKKLIPFIY